MHFHYASDRPMLGPNEVRTSRQMKNIGIVGGGVSSIHLGLSLVTGGAQATIYTPRSAEDIASGRLANTVAHMPDTVARERELGVDFWPEEEVRVCRVRHYALKTGPGKAIDFSGGLDGEERVLDYRIYLPTLMREFERRGGHIKVVDLTPEDLHALYDHHQLLAIGTGRGEGGFADLFPPIEELCFHTTPPRRLCVGTFFGIEDRDPLGVTVSVSPGCGETIALPMVTQNGNVTGVIFESIPGGDLDDLPDMKFERDPRAFHQRLLEVIEAHYPTLFAHVDTHTFQLTGTNDLLQGAFVPMTRQSWAHLGGQRYALAIGDLRCTQDPLTGQGANLGSRRAFALAEQILSSDADFDRAFCDDYEQQSRYEVAGTASFNNAILSLEPHTQQLLAAMSTNESMCTDFSTRFRAPHTIWFDILKDAATCSAYMKRFSGGTEAAA